MLHKLKIRLITLNTMLTGIILSIVVVKAYFINVSQIKQQNLNTFTNLQNSIIDRLESDNTVENSWLSQLEAKNQLIIQIEDNGSSFFFKGSWKPYTNRNKMIDKVRKIAFKEGFIQKNDTIFPDKKLSSIFTLNGDHKEPVYASICILPNAHGSLRVTLIQFFPNQNVQIMIQGFLYLGIDLAGILALFIVSCFFVKKVLKPLEESQKSQNEFIASASHDLRTPLAVIQTSASALLIEGADVDAFVSKINQECSIMSRLISDMLILASSDSKTWSIKKESIDAESYLIGLYDGLSSLCSKRKHLLYLDLPDISLPTIYADKDRLTQVLNILLDNAISYSPDKSTITIRPYCKKAYFVIEVEDHGMGIKAEEKAFIFKRFYRADKSRNDNSHFGLGLSVAKELMELQGGKIGVKDTPEGGATFILELPLNH